MDGRYDNRTVDQFKFDILRGSEIEAEIALRICVFFFQKTKQWYPLVANGIDCTGKFIPEGRGGSQDPDFRINGVPVEIMHSRPMCFKSFHIKLHKVEKCIKSNVRLAMVNGFATNSPKLCFFNSSDMVSLSERSMAQYGVTDHPGNGYNAARVNKAALKIDVDWCKWWNLPRMIDLPTWLPETPTQVLPKSYLEIYKIAKGNI